MPKVSVLVPVYNTSNFLVQCLESLKKQTLEDIEFICINDGSTDNSLEILTNCAKNDNRFRVISKNNSGYGHTMNVGLQNACGEYIGIVESDDFIEPDMYQKLYETAKSYDADIIKSNYWEYSEGKDKLIEPLGNGPYRKVFTPRIEEKSLFLKGQSIWSSIYRREMIEKNKIRFLETPGASYQDTSFYFITMACSDRVVLLENAFLHYRQDNPNSSVKSSGKIYCVCDEFKKIWDFIEEKSELKECLKYVLPEFQWNVYLWNMSRLEDDYKYSFLERLYDEFNEINEKNLLKKECWNNPRAFDKIKKVENGKEKFLYGYYIDEQMERIYKNALISEIRRFKEVCVFGAGHVAKSIIISLGEYQVYPKKIVVSRPEENPANYMDYTVVGIEDISESEKDECLFLVAVKEVSQYHVIRKLQKRGVKNIIAVSKEMRISLMN